VWITDDARKHGIKDAAIQHAFRNPLFVWPPDDDLVMIVGADQTGVRLLEVGYVVADDGEQVVVHAMKCRDKYLPPGW
jgi:hypothetical protein